MGNLFKKIDKILEFSVVIILSVMLGLTVIQVILRYVFNNPTIWSEEFTLFLLVWFGFIVMAMGVRSDSHIALEYFYDRQGDAGRKVLDAVRHLLILGLSVLMVIFGAQMIELGWANKMPATQIRRGYLYASSILGGTLMGAFSLLNLLKLFLSDKGEDNAD